MEGAFAKQDQHVSSENRSVYNFDTITLVSPGEEEQRGQGSYYHPNIQDKFGKDAAAIHIKCRDNAYDGNQVKRDVNYQKVARPRNSLGVRHGDN